MNRRTLTSGFAIGVPFSAVAALSAHDQTPESTPVATPVASDDPLGIVAQVTAIDPESLVATLLTASVNPMMSENFNSFVPYEIPVNTLDLYEEGAVGSVVLLIEGAEGPDQHTVLGGYIVYGSSESAQAAFERNLADAGSAQIIPTSMAGLAGITGVQGDYAAVTLVVGHTLVTANDAFFTDGARLYATDSVFRATVHAVSLLDHLDNVTRPE